MRLLAAIAVFALVLMAGCGGDDGDDGGDGEAGGEGGTLVFAQTSDPVALDGALISDGESLRILSQITEGLTGLRPGSSEVEPRLATDWETSEDGLAWTFNLRENVEFHDGEPFNAEAVCFNFDRWYNFPEAFQNEGASYYWQFGFGGGFANPAEGAPGPDDSLYRSCEAVDENTVRLNLTRPSATVLSTLTLPSLHIVSPAALEEFDADQGTVDEEGLFRPTGTYGTEHPTGTGPFTFGSWTRGEQLEIVRNDDYWGEKAKLERVIFRFIADNAARVQALQSGEVQGMDFVEPQDVPTIEGDENLQLLERPPLNVGYVTFNQALEPMDQLEVRQAVAHAINRQELVDSFYGGRGAVAKEFLPPEVFGYADDVTEYEYDPQRSRELLQEAGLELPVEIDFWYPTDVTRDYMPDPRRNFEAMSADLNAAGFRVRPHSAPWSPDYVTRVNDGKAGHVNLIGWIADFADPDNFLGTFFQEPKAQFGFENQEIHDLLAEAEAETDEARRTELYEEANRMIMDFLPGLPYVHASSALAFQASVTGYEPSPLGVLGEPYNLVSLGNEE